ncbi:MAG: hypothetical protein ACJ8J0_08405 [Longimicrobiaceae bacterium]
MIHKFFVLPAIMAGMAACHPGASRSQSVPVPARAPSSAPGELWRPENYTRDSTYTRGTYLKDIVVVLFRPDAPQAQRQAAVDAVAGRVVGGRPFRDGDGYYFVRVPGNGDPRVLFEAIGVLKALPQVLSATPEYVDAGLRN